MRKAKEAFGLQGTGSFPKYNEQPPVRPDGKIDVDALEDGVVYDTPRGPGKWNSAERQFYPAEQ